MSSGPAAGHQLAKLLPLGLEVPQQQVRQIYGAKADVFHKLLVPSHRLLG